MVKSCDLFWGAIKCFPLQMAAIKLKILVKIVTNKEMQKRRHIILNKRRHKNLKYGQ